jgi:hypothetical protein
MEVNAHKKFALVVLLMRRENYLLPRPISNTTREVVFS